MAIIPLVSSPKECIEETSLFNTNISSLLHTVIIMGNNKANVFLSYASADYVYADLVKTKLNAESIGVWMDQDGLHAGEEWRNGIDAGIIKSNAVLVILTPEACNSAYVTYEWAFALGRKKKVIPLLFKAATIHPRLDVLQHMDFVNLQRAPWEKLAAQIKMFGTDSQQDDKASNLVGDMTVADFQKLLSGAVSLANATAKTAGRDTSQKDISEAAANIVDANIQLGQSGAKLKTILWVDDRPDNNIYERETLSALGFTFDLALSTNEALQKLKPTKYSAIISDMGRAEGPREGYVLLEKVRSIDKAVPYFIYAGSNLPAHKQEAMQRGAQGTTNDPRELMKLVVQHT